ncbi:P-type DNA transfer ATPase VirB11 [Pasteurella multocida]|uniref:P-type DNA transfer ATPase VirB11 n=1 Tax=Pasteurella multocida TaxID=747 RepID=UPI000CE92F9E|nr:P-type DNA transfer ATPase VirB11 [Pasteurella multocida]PPE94933.1 P-type DNA transfer ATPase VirB11 [Pasteurella multocida]PPE95026.1 P-type DNA transfer ATPase VirB11 [Pasteurella multocida]HDR1500988.1 P-type DNA transfer ATPase VirB11 [Pasteurella multocida]
MENVSLKQYIKSLFGDLFEKKEITEIVINKTGEIFYEDNQGFHVGTKDECERVTKENCEKFSNAVATFCGQKLSEKDPILSTTLPNDERIQIVIPPAVDKNQFSITIRKPMSKSLTLEQYQENGFFDDIVIGEHTPKIDFDLADCLNKKDYLGFFRLAVSSGVKNIAIAGATGSGKTTFMKACFNEIPKNERLITIEDVRELFSNKHENIVNLLYPSEARKKDVSVTPASLLKSCLRMKPDRILLAELRAGEAFDYINAISSGHGGSITSLHAGTKDEVIRRLTLMTLQNETGSRLPYDTAKSIIEDTIDIIVHIGKINGQRRITSLYWKDYEKVNTSLSRGEK